MTSGGIRSPRIAKRLSAVKTSTVEALSSMLSRKRKQTEEASHYKFLEDLQASSEVQTLKDLESNISQIDNSLHCELEMISGHYSTAVPSVFPCKGKSYSEDLGSYQPVCLLFSPSGHYKFQVFIHRTVQEGKINLRDVEHVVENLKVNSGYVMRNGIVDYDDIIKDIRIQPLNVKEVWPWRYIGAIKCKLWHKPRKQVSSEEMAEAVLETMCVECKLVRRKMLVVREKRKSLNKESRVEKQQASSKVRVSYLSPESQVRQNNVRRKRKHFRRMAERLISRTVNEEQNNELVKLVSCLESCKEDQESMNKVFDEADGHNPGSGAVIRELWHLEKEAFFTKISEEIVCFMKQYSSFHLTIKKHE